MITKKESKLMHLVRRMRNTASKSIWSLRSTTRSSLRRGCRIKQVFLNNCKYNIPIKVNKMTLNT